MDEIDAKNPGNRTKAYRLRGKVKKGEDVTAEEAAWLADYEKAQAMGASASRKVTYSEEEHAAVGTGSAAEMAAAGVLAREEGRRFDYLLTAGIDALMKACEMYRQMAGQCLERTGQMEDVHMSMLGSVREHYIARVGAEADALRAAAEAEQADPTQALLAILMQRMLPPGTAQLPTVAPKHRKPVPPKRR